MCIEWLNPMTSNRSSAGKRMPCPANVGYAHCSGSSPSLDLQPRHQFVDSRNPKAWSEAKTKLPGALRVSVDEPENIGNVDRDRLFGLAPCVQGRFQYAAKRMPPRAPLVPANEKACSGSDLDERKP